MRLRTVLVVDGAENCAYDCFHASPLLFERIFPGEGQDVEFIEDLLDRTGDGGLDEELAAMWRRRVPKRQVQGTYGVLFYGLLNKKRFHPNKRDSDLDLPLDPAMLRGL